MRTKKTFLAVSDAAWHSWDQLPASKEEPFTALGPQLSVRGGPFVSASVVPHCRCPVKRATMSFTMSNTHMFIFLICSTALKNMHLDAKEKEQKKEIY